MPMCEAVVISIVLFRGPWRCFISGSRVYLLASRRTTEAGGTESGLGLLQQPFGLLGTSWPRPLERRHIGLCGHFPRDRDRQPLRPTPMQSTETTTSYTRQPCPRGSLALPAKPMAPPRTIPSYARPHITATRRSHPLSWPCRGNTWPARRQLPNHSCLPLASLPATYSRLVYPIPTLPSSSQSCPKARSISPSPWICQAGNGRRPSDRPRTSHRRE